MKIKTKTIKLSYPWTGQFKEPGYRIEQLTNSTEFHPATYITKVQATELCASKHWNVTIVPSSQSK